MTPMIPARRQSNLWKATRASGKKNNFKYKQGDELFQCVNDYVIKHKLTVDESYITHRANNPLSEYLLAQEVPIGSVYYQLRIFDVYGDLLYKTIKKYQVSESDIFKILKSLVRERNINSIL